MRARSVALAAVTLVFAGVLSVVMRDAPEPPGVRVAVAAEGANGLTGHYYSRRLDSSSASGIDYAGLYGVSIDEFGLPVQRRAADATRIDPQIAFARPRVARYDKEIPRLEWWTPANASAVVWKGYLHLPKAGTYYVTTISQGASSVHLNRSRVALNAPFGGAIREDAFTYGDVGAPDVSSYATGHYAVPVTVSGPRDLPLEVRYAFHAGAVPWIDLYWVTPDSPRDAAGKPTAEIIPATAFFVEAPGPITEAQVSGPHSTISSDVLYLDTKADSLATLTIRVADKQGRPLSGKRVHVANLASYGFKDTVVQPGAATNELGIATAQVKPYAAGHTAKFFATVLEEAVDIGQVAEVEVFKAGNLALLPRGFAPYYSETFTISPKPLVVGQPTKITVPVGNPLKVPLELSVRFLNSMANIGGSAWTALGETEKFVLKPGETREFSITWTPQKAEGHICFAVEVWGRELPQQAQRANPFTLVASAYAEAPVPAPLQTPTPSAGNPGGGKLLDRRQQNFNSVQPRWQGHCGPYEFFMEPNPGESQLEYAKRTAPLYRLKAKEAEGPLELLIRGGRGGAALTGASERYQGYTAWANCLENELKFANHDKDHCAGLAAGAQHDADMAFREASKCLASPDQCHPLDLPGYVDWMWDLTSERKAYEKCAADPPDPRYRSLAAPAAATPAAYIDAFTSSMERYQAAQFDGDREWMSRHYTAMRLYLKRHGEALRHAADALQQRGEKLPVDDPQTLAGLKDSRNRMMQRLRDTAGPSADELKRLKDAGIAEDVARDLYKRLLAEKELPEVMGQRAALLAMASRYRAVADSVEQHAARPASGGEDGKAGVTHAETFTVANPHDRAEDVDLRIRRASMPPEWTVSIVDAAPTFVERFKNPKIQEVDAGKHYRVRLPAKSEMRVTAELVPMGVVAENTTARWAVEGKIGDELLGGIVQEMHVPAIVADLQLPAVGSVEATTTVPGAAGSLDSRWRIVVLTVGVALAALLAMFFLVWRRRRKASQAG